MKCVMDFFIMGITQSHSSLQTLSHNTNEETFSFIEYEFFFVFICQQNTKIVLNLVPDCTYSCVVTSLKIRDSERDCTSLHVYFITDKSKGSRGGGIDLFCLPLFSFFFHVM